MQKLGNAEPAVLTGRDEALAELEGLVRAKRLVTVTGPGGVGKSALVAELARRMASEPWEASGRAELARLDGPELLPHTLARALERDGPPGLPQPVALAAALGGAAALLVVDTCEHLAAACARVLAELVDACPGLHVLATSRTPMNTPGRYPLPPLPLDAAVGLFTASARQLGAGVEVPDPEAAREICRFLDGLPLAVRIAAGQLARGSVGDLLYLVSRAEAVLDLPAPMSGLPPRQRTLRDSLRRNAALCTPAELLLWARCSVFPGFFRLEDVQEVCSDERLPAGSLAAAFTGLGRQSLIIRQPREPVGTVFRMPRSTRAYGRQELDRLGEDVEFLRRCLTWLLRDT